MKTYEITFIDLGFLVSPELWRAWIFAGIIVGCLVIAGQITGPREARSRRRRRIKRVGWGWTLFAIWFSVVAWPVAFYIWLKSRFQ